MEYKKIIKKRGRKSKNDQDKNMNQALIKTNVNLKKKSYNIHKLL